MITRLVWTTWTAMSAVPKRPLNLITHSLSCKMLVCYILQDVYLRCCPCFSFFYAKLRLIYFTIIYSVNGAMFSGNVRLMRNLDRKRHKQPHYISQRVVVSGTSPSQTHNDVSTWHDNQIRHVWLSPVGQCYSFKYDPSHHKRWSMRKE